MSAALKQQRPGVTPTPFPSPERAALAAAIVAVSAAGARRAALERAVAEADRQVMAAIVAAERADGAVAEASVNAVRYLTDQALGTAGEAPQTIRQAKAALAEAKDHLEACREARAALQAELATDKSDFVTMRLDDAARAVIVAEMGERGVALADRVRRLQRELVAVGSGLEWLAGAGVFGRPVDPDVRSIVWQLDSPPTRWSATLDRNEKPFCQRTGALRWAEAFEALKRDAGTLLPVADE